jgi:hypothetical protein
MHGPTRLRALGLAAAFVLAAAVSTASAGRISINEQNFYVNSPALSFVTAVGEVTCQLSLTGSFHSRTITKVLGALVGLITSAQIGTCEGGTATVLTGTLPWHLTYNGFTGRLPAITGINLRLIRASFRVSNGTACLAASSTAQPMGFTANINERTGQVSSVQADETFEIDLEDESFPCAIAGDASTRGSAAMCMVTQGLAFIRLI